MCGTGPTGEGCAHVEERLLIIGSITLRCRGLLHVAAAALFVAGDQCSLCRTVREAVTVAAEREVLEPIVGLDCCRHDVITNCHNL